MTWSATAWQASQPVYDRMVEMPFTRELAQGTLTQSRFQGFVVQDALYLADFGRALSLVAARSGTHAHALAFSRFSQGAMTVADALHTDYLSRFALASAPRMTPSCSHYTHFLLSTAALAPLEVAMAALLPCFWLYKVVGDGIHAQQQDGENPYRAWIDTYASQEFAATVTRAITVCDDMADTCTPAQREAMTQAFVTSARLEWMLWDSAWREESWPV